MKPDWKDAPEWANWLAMDKDGEWFWYENEPVIDGEDQGVWDASGRFHSILFSCGWEETKQKRPQQ